MRARRKGFWMLHTASAKIVKAVSVVESGAVKPPLPPALAEVEPGGVLKRGMLNGNIQQAQRVMPTKDAYTDELNRLRVEIKQAKEALKALGMDREEALRQAEEAAIRQEEAAAAELVQEDPEETVNNAKLHAENILASAMDERDTILNEAHAQAVMITDQAKNEGYLEGFSKGFEEATQEFKDENTPKAVMIADLLESLGDYQEELVRKSEDDMVNLAMTIASKILGKVVESDPTAIVDILHGVMEENKREEYIKITLSPELTAIKAKAGKDVRSLLEKHGANVSVVNDPAASKGSIIVETPKGVVDVSIQTQLDNLGAAIREK